MHSLELSMIGNSSYASLIDPTGRIIWACMPRFDGNPVFCDLLEPETEIGFYDIEIEGFLRSEQTYRPNSALVETCLFAENGAAIEILDFAPRFKQFGRIFRPLTLVRRIRRLGGAPRIRIRLRPAGNYGAEKPTITRGSNHIRYILPDHVLRLTTDVPVSFVLDETPFLLDQPVDLILAQDEGLTRPVREIARDFEEQTHEYWREWVRYLAVPFEWQEAVIRAAITLKLCSVEDSGAIVAAVTTSVPEAAGTERNWDYRFCWLRDAYFTIRALNRLGATRTMEEFLRYILNIVASSPDGRLQPVFGVQMETTLSESAVDSLRGYRGHQPVRVGNLAYVQTQHDVYGAVVLACAQAFFDQRIDLEGDDRLFETLERIGETAARMFDQPDAGLWELRGRQRPHTFSALMCWAACDRLARIAMQLDHPDRASVWNGHARTIRARIEQDGWNDEKRAYVSAFGGTEVDAALLLMHELSFCEADDPRFLGTIAAVERELLRGDHVFRYVEADDFGTPHNAFNVCTFWYIDALAAVGRRDEARRLFENMLACRNQAGLLSEDLNTETNELWGNIPQTYSMVGLIVSALRLSKSWEEAF